MKPHHDRPYAKLHALFSLYSENYLHLHRQRSRREGDWHCVLNSGTESESCWEFVLVERTPYTELLHIRQVRDRFQVLFIVRVYHDVQMAEVEGAQQVRRLRNYRRPRLEADDERTAWNLLLRDLLRLCRTRGEVVCPELAQDAKRSPIQQ